MLEEREYMVLTYADDLVLVSKMERGMRCWGDSGVIWKGRNWKLNGNGHEVP